MGDEESITDEIVEMKQFMYKHKELPNVLLTIEAENEDVAYDILVGLVDVHEMWELEQSD